MDLILWRHADAEDGADDLARKLTAKGEAQAAKVGAWLRKHLPKDAVLVSSPAVRAQQTAKVLGVPIITDKSIAPGASPAAIVKAAEKHKGTVILVGHQPDFGRALAHVVAGKEADWAIEKGGLWWLAGKTVKAVISPDLL
jgi:phosphohistidine phosphatase